MAGTGYAFGDDELAARRLELVAGMYAATTAAFADGLGAVGAGLVVDLGCGPGFSTALLHERLAPARLVGVEASAAFAEQARRRLRAAAEVVCADVRALPDDVGDVDLAFARLLVTHLPDPGTAIAHWLRRLAPAGRLALEEVDSIATEEPVLATYLALQERMLEAGGHRLGVGPVVAGAARRTGEVLADDLVRLTPPTATAARIFHMNFAGWRARPVVARLADAAQLDAIERGLAALAADDADAAAITWTMRHIVVAAPAIVGA